MQIFNTKTRQKEEFKALKWDKIKVYYCGPTVYNYAHIWNLKTFVFEDIVVRTLRFLWEKVETTMNITDVDDKTIRDSILAWESLKDFTKKYTKTFFEDLEKLNVVKADNIIPVTEVIPEMVRLINTMLRRWKAYLSDDGSIYFKVSSFKRYGQLSGLKLEDLKNWVRIDNDEYSKDSFGDFVLWKAYKPEDWENFWEEKFEINPHLASPQGEEQKKLSLLEERAGVRTIKWRPGWHIECSACNMKAFWPQIDIHMWGEDLIFPHHENEIAQTESCTRKEFSKYWLHSGHIMVDGKKMSKSLWNFYTLKDLENKFKKENKSVLYRAIRLSFIWWKYRDSINFSLELVEKNIATINKIDETIKNINTSINSWEKKIMWISKEFSNTMQEYMQEFVRLLEDDFNTPEALSLFFWLNKFVNSNIRDELLSLDEIKSLLDLYKTFNEVLAIMDFDILEENIEILPEALKKLEDRNKAKSEKNYKLADKLRDELTLMWYKIIDSREGSRVEKI